MKSLSDRPWQAFSSPWLLLLLLVASKAELKAQVGDIDPPPYPDWVASDKVVPQLTLGVEHDTVRALWTYRYTVGNGLSAEQDIWNLKLRYYGWAASATAPPGWWVYAVGEVTFDPTDLESGGAVFQADLPSDFEGPYWSASDYQIPPGDSLSGFMLESPYPPGYARTYAQGYAQVPFPPDPREDPDAYYAAHPAPHDTTNSQRGWTIGPEIYREVVTSGDGAEPGDGFLGFMNLSVTGSQLMDPAPIALEVAVNGETVFPETLRVMLNGQDVTTAFHPGRADGADLVGPFFTDSSPLLDGSNLLVTVIEGIDPISGLRVTDTDAIEFTVSGSADG